MKYQTTHTQDGRKITVFPNAILSGNFPYCTVKAYYAGQLMGTKMLSKVSIAQCRAYADDISFILSRQQTTQNVINYLDGEKFNTRNVRQADGTRATYRQETGF